MVALLLDRDDVVGLLEDLFLEAVFVRQCLLVLSFQICVFVRQASDVGLLLVDQSLELILFGMVCLLELRHVLLVSGMHLLKLCLLL